MFFGLSAMVLRFLVIIGLTLIDWKDQKANYQANREKQSFSYTSNIHFGSPLLRQCE
jgi:hypothetical protein